MSSDPSQFDDWLDALVRADLDRRADAVDPRPLLARIQATALGSSVAKPQAPAGTVRFRRAIRWAGGLSAAAAAVAACVFLLSQTTPAVQASPEAIVREAQRAAAVPLDRCYLVEVRRESDDLDQQSFLLNQQARVSRLWTRGDRFLFESLNSPRRFAWGRDGSGTFWVSLNRDKGLQFEPSEVPQWLTLSADVVGMRMDHLLDAAARDFDLAREQPPAGSPAGAIVIRATPKPGRTHPSLRGARIEFDGDTKVVRKLVLERARMGKPVATVTYWLIDTEARADGQYELAGHLEASAEVFSRSNRPWLRDAMARVFFAASAGGEIPQMPPPGTAGARSPGMRPGADRPRGTTRPATRASD